MKITKLNICFMQKDGYYFSDENNDCSNECIIFCSICLDKIGCK